MDSIELFGDLDWRGDASCIEGNVVLVANEEDKSMVGAEHPGSAVFISDGAYLLKIFIDIFHV